MWRQPGLLRYGTSLAGRQSDCTHPMAPSGGRPLPLWARVLEGRVLPCSFCTQHHGHREDTQTKHKRKTYHGHLGHLQREVAPKGGGAQARGQANQGCNPDSDHDSWCGLGRVTPPLRFLAGIRVGGQFPTGSSSSLNENSKRNRVSLVTKSGIT